VVKLGSSCVV
jgi:hypothetical protein